MDKTQTSARPEVPHLPARDAGALFAEHALLPGGWARDVLLRWDAGGRLVCAAPGSDAGDAPRAPGPVVPGMPNLHSHAFQRAFAGLTEYRAQEIGRASCRERV